MSRKIVKNIIAFYSIAVGIAALTATLSSKINPITITIELLFVCAGVLLLSLGENKTRKVILITLVILYLIGLLGSIPFIISDTVVGIIAFVIFGIPLSFGIVYFAIIKK